MPIHPQPLPHWLPYLLLAPAALFLVLWLVKRASGARFRLKTPLLSVPEQNLYIRLVDALPEHVVPAIN